MKTRNKIMIALVAILFVVAGVLVIVGVVTHTEAGLLEGVPQWDRADFPLKVSAESYAAGGALTSDHRGSVDHVIGLVNGRLDFDVFRWAEDGEDPDVAITIGVPFDSDWDHPGGHSEIAHHGPRADLCNVETSNTGTGELLGLTLHHELGHCLGLAHDDFEISIMRPEQSPTPDRTIPPWITDSDRGLLRDLYGPR